jgi:hypothetical protein
MTSKKAPGNSKAVSVEQARDKIAKAMRDLAAGHDPGPIPFCLKRTRKADESYPLRLTQQQRESMIHATRIKNKVKERLQQAKGGTQVVGFTLKELDHLNDELGQAALYAPGTDKKRLISVLHKVTDLFSEEYAGVFEGVVPTTRKTAPKTGDLIYQFKVRLLDIKPAIWRRIQVPDCTLADLHEYIQAAFGWWNYHMHQFAIDGERYDPPAPDDMDFGLAMIDETGITLSKLIPSRAGNPGGCTNTTSATAGGTRSCSRDLSPWTRRRSTRSVSRAHGPAHRRTAAGCGATPITSPLSLIHTTSDTRNCWSGGGRSTPKPSMRRKRRGR